MGIAHDDAATRKQRVLSLGVSLIYAGCRCKVHGMVTATEGRNYELPATELYQPTCMGSPRTANPSDRCYSLHFGLLTFAGMRP